MKGYVENIISNYQDMVKERDQISKRLRELQDEFLTDRDIIEALSFSHPDGDRVQTSGTSDKTCKIALCYRDKRNQVLDDSYKYWTGRYNEINSEIETFEEAVKRLPNDLSEVIQLIVIDNNTWEQAGTMLCMSRMSLHRVRKQAIDELVRIYRRKEAMECSILLG